MKTDLNITFYKEEKFKETPIGKIPKDWEIIKLKDQVNIETGKRAKGGALEKGNVASIGGEHLDDEGNIQWDNMKFIPEDFYNALKQGKVKLGDILLVKDGATTGKVAIVKNLLYEKAAVNEHVFIIRSKVDKVINEFLFYFLFSKFGQIQIKTIFHGMIGGITRKDIERILAPLPPLPEQRKIVEILSTVDEAIQKTDEIIEKIERLKKGLMQELLTKGIGHKEFKDTEIGRIPKEWEVVRLGGIGEFQYGITASASDEDTGVKLLRITDITNQGIEWEKVPYCSVTNTEFRKYRLGIGDVLIARIGATTGKSCYVDQQINAVFGSYLLRFRPKVKLVTEFLYYYTQSDIYWTQVNKKKEGQLKKGLNITTLGSLLLPLPAFTEQQRITQILSTIEKKLALERNEKTRLERIKQGLMDLLLTGKIRVKVN